MMRIHIISLFPNACRPYFACSVIGRAVEKGIAEVYHYNPIDKVPALKRVDDRSYGGGPGMVLQAKPFLDCFDDAKQYEGTRKALFLTPGGMVFTQEKAKECANFQNLILFCGHYEGIDERVAEASDAERLSVGPYILTGGEIPALLIADTVIRLLPGVLGNAESHEDSRVAGSKVYTRPESFRYEGKEYNVPEVLLSGHHGEINAYRQSSQKK